MLRHHEAAVAAYQGYLESLSPEGDAAQETRNSRAWDRAWKAIDRAESPTAEARNQIRKASDSDLGVLLREIPAHLETLRAPTDWVSRAVEERSPELAAKRSAVEKSSQAVSVMRHEASRLRQSFADGRPLASPLVDGSKFDPEPEA